MLVFWCVCVIVESARSVRFLVFLSLEFGQSVSFQVFEVVESARRVRFLVFMTLEFCRSVSFWCLS